MPKGLLDADTDTRRVTIYDKADDGLFIRTEQDCSYIADAAKVLSHETPGKDFRLVGFVPEEVMNKWFIDGSFNDPKTIKRWMNDPDNARFRVWGGRL